MKRTRIKICGITSMEAAGVAVEAGADAIGAVLVNKSARNVSMDFAIQLRSTTGPYVDVVAVFENQRFKDHSNCDWGFEGTIQLHGECNKKDFTLPYYVIRALPFDPDAIAEWESFDGVGALLIDAETPGSGESFDHAALAELMPSISKPVILAGGLTPENVGEAIRTVKPYAVDVSSGVESSPGVKDPKLIHEFCQAVREADLSIA